MLESETLLRKNVIENARCVVIKVGTRVLTTPEGTLDLERVDLLSAQLCRIAETGRQVIMVSSGAVGAGVARLGLDKRPTGLADLQAVAAIGQTDLIRAYERSLSKRERHAAQVLLTRDDLRRRSGYLNVRNALHGLHRLGAIPIVNENDSVAIAELQTTFGDNDQLAAHVAGLVSDTLLVILSDISGLYDGPPDQPGSSLVSLVRSLDRDVMALANDASNSVSKGGMSSKLNAAKIAGSHGHPVIIGSGRQDDILDRILAGDQVGTLFMPQSRTIRGKRRWIAGVTDVEGILHVDSGAAKAVVERGKSLLAIGITRVEGEFSPGEVASIKDPKGIEIARGLSNYRSDEIAQIVGKSRDQIADILKYRPHDSVIHRNNMVIDTAGE